MLFADNSYVIDSQMQLDYTATDCAKTKTIDVNTYTVSLQKSIPTSNFVLCKQIRKNLYKVITL